LLTIAATLGAALLLCGCAGGSASGPGSDIAGFITGNPTTTTAFFHEDNTPLTSVNAKAADAIMGLFTAPAVKHYPIYVQPFTNQVDMNDASPFGALVSDQVASRLTSRGFRITQGVPHVERRRPEPRPEPKAEAGSAPDGLAAADEGAKAPEQRGLSPEDMPHDCLLSGTYLLADKVIYVSARITQLDDNHVLGAHSWTIPVNRNTRALLPQLRRGDGMAPSVRTSLALPPHVMANPTGQSDVHSGRDLLR
jgi:hypothetical protein